MATRRASMRLTLSNASHGQLTDDEATGTIKNRDPLPRALLARFGRTAAVHVVEHVEERLQAPRAPGFEGRVAGRELRRRMERDIAVNVLRQLGGSTGANPAAAGVHGLMAGAAAGMPGTPGLSGTPGLANRMSMTGPGGAMGRSPRGRRRWAGRGQPAPDGPRQRRPADRIGLRHEPRDPRWSAPTTRAGRW